MKSMVARLFKGLDPEQMAACGGKTMPKVGGRNLHEDSQAFGDWVKAQVREHRAAQLESLSAAEISLLESIQAAQRQVDLYSEQLRKNTERQAAIRARPRV